MKPLILTGWPSREFTDPEFADLMIFFNFRFCWGPLPSTDELATYLGPGTPDVEHGHHWSDFATRWKKSRNGHLDELSLAEFSQHYETVELWFDTRPNAQLKLICSSIISGLIRKRSPG